MKTLIVYYSRTGTNRATATVLQTKINSDIEEIREEAGRSSGSGYGLDMVRILFESLLGKSTKIKPIEKSPGNYDLVIVVTPIWGGNLPPAVRTYLKENKARIKEAAVLSVSGSGEKNEKFLPAFESAVGKKPKTALLLSKGDIKDKELGELMKPLLRKIL